MLRILGTRKALCDGLSRRDFLNIGALSPLGLGLAEALNYQALAGSNEQSLGSAFGKAKSCILLFPYGSPSSHETFDPKPDAPVEIQGEMKAIPSNVPGLHIVDRLPGVAQVMDRVTVVRSMSHPYPAHGLAYAVTGIPTYTSALESRARDTRHWPFIGSVVDYVEQGRSPAAVSEIPRNIGLPWMVNSKTDNPAVNAGPFAAFLGREFDPVWTDFNGKGLHIAPKNTVAQTLRFRNPFGGTSPEGRFLMPGSSELPADVTVDRLRLRRSLLKQFELARSALDNVGETSALDKHRQLAYSLLTSSPMHTALDIGREPRKLRESYGMNLFGQACLAARRIVEAGGKFVTVFWDCYGQFANGSWDTHQYHYPRLKNLLLPGLDRALPALVRDLEQRGMLDETLVIWMSEHGRTPKITDKPGAGREHWSRAYSVLLAGGGIAKGNVVGRTTRDGGEVAENPVSPKDILATAYYLLGIDPNTFIYDKLDRPHPIAGSGRTRHELLG